MNHTVDFSPETLRSWLEWAGGKLLALPSPHLKPQKPRALWPDYMQNPYEVTHFRPKESFPLHVAAPTAEEIPFMDRILILPNLCPDQRFRRIIHSRSLVYPFNGRYLYTWVRLANILHVSNATVKTWHKKGLLSVCRKISAEELREIGEFMER